jgi:hypothetical protein
VSKGDVKEYITLHTSANVLQQGSENWVNFPVRRFRFFDDYMKLTQP